ncbi:unnamed protein product [Microthlaspi erraticum]|uniref:Uncharacterized protein n=1 Tax=Microthlaspi erraticum TaxID=1685480 RepID=A0A6D2HW46_9BRAS|nr:unnamed protein product [Microthlaspi erraticum]
MAQSLKLPTLLCFTFFIISLLLSQTQARNVQTITELTDLNQSVPVQEQEPVFVRDTGHGYGLYGRREGHTKNEEDNSNDIDDNDQFYYRSDAYGNRNGRF